LELNPKEQISTLTSEILIKISVKYRVFCRIRSKIEEKKFFSSKKQSRQKMADFAPGSAEIAIFYQQK
jgi:hypothetical protein